MNNCTLKHIVIFIGLCLLAPLVSKAQDPIFSQFFAAPTFTSPSLVGSTGGVRAATNYRNQWPGVSNAYENYAVSADMYVNTIKSGFGVLVWQDVSGSAELKKFNAAFQYTYRVQLGNDWTMIPGLEIAYAQHSVNPMKLDFGDDLYYGQPTGDPSILDKSSVSFMDAGVSAFFYNRKYWFGVNFDHIMQPTYSFLSQDNYLPLSFSTFGGINLWRTKGNRQTNPRSYCLSYRFIHQGNANQLDLGGYYFNRNWEFGVWWRGVPITDKERTDVMFNNDAVVLSAAVIVEAFRIGYSYDITVSDLSSSSAGAHEISIIWEIGDVFGCGAKYLDCFTKRAGHKFTKRQPRNLKVR